MKTFLILFLALPLACLAGQPFLVNSPQPVVSGGGGGANYVRVQAKFAQSTAVALDVNATAGNTIVLIGSSIGLAPTSVTDVNGDTFTNVITYNNGGMDYQPGVAIFIAFNVVGGADSSTFYASGMGAGFGGGYSCLTAIEYSGVTSCGVSVAIPGTSPVGDLTTSTTGFFVSGSGGANAAVTATLNSVGATVVGSNTGFARFHEAWEWLPSSAGYPADTYTEVTGSSDSQYVAVGVQLK